MTDEEFFAELDAIFRDFLENQEPLGYEFEQAWDGNQEGLYIDSADGK